MEACYIMKSKVKQSVVLFLSLLFVIGVAQTSWAEFVHVYFEMPQNITIPFNRTTNSASGSSIIMQDFTVGSTLIQDASFSFSFVGGAGSLLVTKGVNTFFSAYISGAEIQPLGKNFFQIFADTAPSTVGSPLYTFDYGQINLTFLPNGSYTQGYFQAYDESKTPIPGAAWLLGTGLFGLIAIRRRKKT